MLRKINQECKKCPYAIPAKMCATMFSNCPIELKNCYTENTNPIKEVCFDVFFGMSPNTERDPLT